MIDAEIGTDIGSRRAATAACRGRPRAFDREAALAQATRLFWRKGYRATSIADLTEAMGIGSPSLYAAFGSKEALYAEALRHYGDEYEALVWGRFAPPRTAREAVEALLWIPPRPSPAASADEPPGCMVTLSAVGSEGHVELGERVRAARAAAVTRIEQRLDQAAGDELGADTDDRPRAPRRGRSERHVDHGPRRRQPSAELEAVARHAMRAWRGRRRA